MFIINSDLLVGCLIRGLPNVLTMNFYDKGSYLFGDFLGELVNSLQQSSESYGL